MRCKSGRPKAAVLPVLVRALATMSRPAVRGAMAAAWMGVGRSKPSAAMFERIRASR